MKPETITALGNTHLQSRIGTAPFTNPDMRGMLLMNIIFFCGQESCKRRVILHIKARLMSKYT